MFHCIDPKTKSVFFSPFYDSAVWSGARTTQLRRDPSEDFPFFDLRVVMTIRTKKIRRYRMNVLSTPRWSSRYNQVVPSATLAKWKLIFPFHIELNFDEKKNFFFSSFFLSFFLWCEKAENQWEKSLIVQKKRKVLDESSIEFRQWCGAKIFLLLIWRFCEELEKSGASRRLYCPVTAVLFEHCLLLLSRDICIVCQAKRLTNGRSSLEWIR